MSFDIMLQHFTGGECSTFPRALVESSFGPFVVHRTDSFIRVRYPDDSGADMWFDNVENIDHIMFNHCGGNTFTKAMFELMKRTGSVIYWPGGRAVVADRSVIDTLPPDIVKALGTPTVISAPQEIRDAIART